MDYNNAGLLTALHAFGAQDKWFSDSAFDGKKQLLANQQYKSAYGKLDAERKVSGHWLNFTVSRQCDLINKVDLVIPSKFYINNVIRKIEVTFGGQRIDVLSVAEDIETQIKTNAIIFKRTISTIGDKTFIPLVMAPFHDNNLVFPSSQWHRLVIMVQLQKDFFDKHPDQSFNDFELYGHRYMVGDKTKLFDYGHEFITVQNQYSGAEPLKKGINSIKLNYNHPVYLIYLWGFDKSKVQHVRLLLDGVTFLDASIADLEHQKACRGFAHVKPLMLFLSENDPGEHTKTTVNFSRIDQAILEIDTLEESAPMYGVGLNIQPLRYSQGMVGLVFSK